METGRNVMHYALGDNQDYENEWSKAVLEYLENGYSSEDSKSEVEVGNATYKILKREKVTVFYDADGNTLFDIENDRLKEEYGAIDLSESEPQSEMGKAISGIEKQAFEQTVNNDADADDAVPIGKASLKEIAEGIPAPTPQKVEAAKENNNSSVYIGVVGAVTKLQEELKKAKDKEFAKPVVEHLIERCKESESLASDVCQDHKTWEKCYKYIYEQARKQAKGGCWQYSYMRYKERTDPRIERKQNMAKDWIEYLEWCRELKYDLNNMFIYMPTNFKKVHDRTAQEYMALKDKIAAAEKKRRERLAAKKMAETKKAMEEIFSKNDGVDAFQIKGKGLILVVPKTGDEIRREGEALHHCVGGYVERVARGETNIFFVRKADQPDKSYFMMEWRDNKIIQCRGFKNCGMPADVQAFVNVFAEKMLEAAKNDAGLEKSERKAG
nr:MAG TPA: PcfJ like protein [Caudoviricetes sp.]